jgi:hypothetical protein
MGHYKSRRHSLISLVKMREASRKTRIGIGNESFNSGRQYLRNLGTLETILGSSKAFFIDTVYGRNLLQQISTSKHLRMDELSNIEAQLTWG